MANFTFDIAYFRQLFPEFANTTQYPDARLQLNWDIATCFVSDQDYGWLNGDCRFKALNFMTAHITSYTTQTTQGDIPNFVQSSSIDKISAQVLPPPIKSQFQYSLSKTPYGEMVLTLLTVSSVGGIYVGGSNDINNFRVGEGWP